MKILVLGATGMLGHVVAEHLLESYDDVYVSTRDDYDHAYNHNRIHLDALYPENGLENLRHNFDYVINCIGVVIPEISRIGVVDTIKINSVFPHLLAKWCDSNNTKLIHITTDCVFSGVRGNYTEHNVHDANSIYAKSKSLGEPENCMCLRTSIIGPEVHHSRNLVEWAKSQEGKKVNGYMHHYWNGITTLQFAKICKQIIDKEMYTTGLYHVFSPGSVSKFTLLELLNDRYGLGLQIEGLAYDEDEKYGAPVDRTLNTVKDINDRLDIPSITQQIKEM